MKKIVKLVEASRMFNLSESELRRGARIGKYPHMRIGGKNGTIVFDVDMLEARIKELMQENLKEII